jgi:succinoglycan biosynthesis protein ExoA
MPIVSVVVPCRNEKDHIEACVRSILAQEPPRGDFEIIIADGMSDDGTREKLDRLEKADTRVRVITIQAVSLRQVSMLLSKSQRET